MIAVPRSQKITPMHLERKAVVYIRQSAPKQVRLNPESQHNQRRLSEWAEQLRWSKERIVILDADLGHSGASTTGRDDFTLLTADVALGYHLWMRNVPACTKQRGLVSAYQGKV